jgi:hypothetical protein
MKKAPHTATEQSDRSQQSQTPVSDEPVRCLPERPLALPERPLALNGARPVGTAFQLGRTASAWSVGAAVGPSLVDGAEDLTMAARTFDERAKPPPQRTQ